MLCHTFDEDLHIFSLISTTSFDFLQCMMDKDLITRGQNLVTILMSYFEFISFASLTGEHEKN